jgi:biotin operon repressor
MTYSIHNQRSEMKRLRQDEHLTLTEIGDRVGASRTAVRMNLKAMGIDTHRQKRQSPSL